MFNDTPKNKKLIKKNTKNNERTEKYQAMGMDIHALFC